MLQTLTPYLYAAIRIIIYALPVILAASAAVSVYLAILRYRFAKREGKSHRGSIMFAVRAVVYSGVAIFLAKSLYFH
jgi:hypothetical protein